MNSEQENLQPQVQSLRENGRPEHETDISELFGAIWQGKWIIIAITSVVAVLSVIYALSLPNIYRSEALLAPVNDESSMRIPGQLGGLAALAGVNIGSGDSDKTALAIEVLKSRDFIGRFIEKYDLFIPVMAAEGWSRETNSLKIIDDVYDPATEQWIRDVKPPYMPKPSVQETYKEFIDILSVNHDKTSGMVKVSIEHYSPYLAQQWVSWLVDDINREMRQRELMEAERSIAYLNKQIAETTLADARAMLFSLVEEQTKTVMLANVRSEYVFKTVDPAVVAEKEAKPARALICILGVVLGGMFSVLVVLIRYFKRIRS